MEFVRAAQERSGFDEGEALVLGVEKIRRDRLLIVVTDRNVVVASFLSVRQSGRFSIS